MNLEGVVALVRCADEDHNAPPANLALEPLSGSAAAQRNR